MSQKLYTKALLSCLLIFCSIVTNGQITGKVYQDNNGDTRQNTNEKGLAEIIVKAFDAKGRILKETKTDTSGNYLLDIPSGKRVRVELSNIPEEMYNTPTNFQNGTRTQFLVSPKSANNIGLFNPALFDNGEARAVSVSYTLGSGKDPLGDSDTSSVVSLFSAVNPQKRFTLATMSEVGALWGLAYDKNRERLYMSAFAKRHVGYGKLGPGGIYYMDFSSGIIKPLLQNSKELNVFAGEDKHTGLGGVFNNGNRFNNIDSVFFSQVGAASYGGLDISEDGNYLYVVNLNTRQLMKIAISSDNTPLKSTDIELIDIANIPYSEGTVRPFAVKVYGKKVYIGLVFDAFKSQKASDLKASVYELNPTTKELKEVFTMALDYPKGYPEAGYKSRRGWYPWTDDFTKGLVTESSGFWAIYPQPILSDIEFDIDGSMVLGFMDRFGHQGATLAHSNDPSKNALVECGGDIIRVALVKGKFQLENNAKAGNITTKGKDNNQGPGGGEYYFEDYFATTVGNIISEESASGGLAILPSTGELLATHREPRQFNWATTLQGVRYYNNQTGTYTRSVILPSRGFQKANGAGDVELVVDAPTTEIGDRVWFDCNENGIQETDEQPIKNVLVELYQDGKAISKTTTNALGEYTFKDDNVPKGLLMGKEYEIRVALNQSRYQGLQLTKTLVGTNKEIDSDALIEGTNAVIKIKLDGAGQNNYSLDFGFKCLVKPQATPIINCSGNTNTKDAIISIKGFDPNDKYDVSKGNTYENDLDFNAAKVIPIDGKIFLDKIDLYTSSEYTIRLFNQSCYTDFVINTIDNKECYQKVLATENIEKEIELFTIYPNPASSVILIEYTEKGQEEVSIELVDSQGRKLESKRVRKSGNKYVTSFDVSSLVSGTYFVSISNNLNKVSKKFFKN